jgi:hypothetical protein
LYKHDLPWEKEIKESRGYNAKCMYKPSLQETPLSEIHTHLKNAEI